MKLKFLTAPVHGLWPGNCVLPPRRFLNSLTKAVGTWTGKSKTDVADWRTCPRQRESNLTVTTTAMGRFIVLSYTWKFDGKDQEGMLLLGAGKDGRPPRGWTVNNGDKIMPMRGESDGNKVTLMGSLCRAARTGLEVAFRGQRRCRTTQADDDEHHA